MICTEELLKAEACSLEASDCRHKFHAECIQLWAESVVRNKSQPTCPLCKAPFRTILFCGERIELVSEEDLENNEEDDDEENFEEYEDEDEDEDEDDEEDDEDEDEDYYDEDEVDEPEYERCVVCLAEMTNLTPNVSRCSQRGCRSKIHHHCLLDGQEAGTWACNPCRDRLAEQQRQQERHQQQREERQRQRQHAARRQRARARPRSPAPAPAPAGSEARIRDQIAKARHAAEASQTSATYFCRTEAEVALGFQRARAVLAARANLASSALASAAAAAAAASIAPGVPIKAKAKLTSLLALEAASAVNANPPAPPAFAAAAAGAAGAAGAGAGAVVGHKRLRKSDLVARQKEKGKETVRPAPSSSSSSSAVSKIVRLR